MSPLVKSAILGFGLLAGATASAYAQSENIAALPPQRAVTPPSAVAPVAPGAVFLGPNPGMTWSAAESSPASAQSSQQLSTTERGGQRNDEE